YSQAGIEPGQLFDMQVADITVESEQVKSFKLVPANGAAAPAFKPGQYISVAVHLSSGVRQLRQYSLSDAPANDHLRISVKREPANGATPAGMVSNWLHGTLPVGRTVVVSEPSGDLTADTEGAQPIVLLSAGVGITPMVWVLNRIAEVAPQREVVFAQAG